MADAVDALSSEEPTLQEDEKEDEEPGEVTEQEQQVSEETVDVLPGIGENDDASEAVREQIVEKDRVDTVSLWGKILFFLPQNHLDMVKCRGCSDYRLGRLRDLIILVDFKF